jgi:plasmid stabilization system protein ParE
MAEINWTAEAELWLKDIYDYIARDKPGAAAKVVSGICKNVQILKDFPEIGYKYRGTRRRYPHSSLRSLQNRLSDQERRYY